MPRCPICKCQVRNCECLGFAHLCKTCRIKSTLDEQGNCTCCSICKGSKVNDSCSCCTTCQLSAANCTASCDCCPRCQTTKGNCNCPSEAETPKISTMSMCTNLEPPDISVLRDRSRLDYYITALERWANLAKASGVSDTLHADLVLHQAYKQSPDLGMEMSDNFNDTLGAVHILHHTILGLS